MILARERDQNDLISRLDSLAKNDQRILDALQAGEHQFRRFEEFLVAFTKVSFFAHQRGQFGSKVTRYSILEIRHNHRGFYHWEKAVPYTFDCFVCHQY